MLTDTVRTRLAGLTTAHLADACLRAGVPVRCGPSGLRAALPGASIAGTVLPARHIGTVDIFLEALETAEPGDVLVVDNGGRVDESCVGDLVALEAQAAGLAGLVLWGLHRDTGDLREIGLPVFSLGTLPTGPQRLDPRPEDALISARVGQWTVTRADLVVADEDGVLFLPADRSEVLLGLAEQIRDMERLQAAQMRAGRSLRQQLQFRHYLAARQIHPDHTFREHLQRIGGAIEE